jgi:hypothetical protein
VKPFFYSLKAGYLFFALLALIFAMGNQLTAIKAYQVLFKNMTATHVGQCLNDIFATPLILIWLLFFTLAGAGLFVNTWCCTTLQIRSFFRTRSQGSPKENRLGLKTLIHILSLLVISLHALDITLIQRHRPVKTYAGQTIRLGSCEIRVKTISCVARPSMIMEDETGGTVKSVHLPEKEFSIKDNVAIIEIMKDSKILAKRELRILSPVRFGATFIFLDGFFIAHGGETVGVKIHHSDNPLALVFFAVYILLLGLLVMRFFAIKWRENGVGEPQIDDKTRY